ncbi:alpha/beta fold hydrolase [Sphaerotilus sp.]|uniref:alpha/beta hydrolase n=1 Tax=Sphaerotilus sp. TaxID=2093942 RepID=UPI00286DA81E|nr:alpha/beta fold hydrolase [Sphaerotilus sp.]
MNAQTERLHVAGPAGAIEVAVDQPPGIDAPRGVAVLAHPHPLFGGTMDNKVVQTMARAFLQMGYRTVRFNFRGVGTTEGTHDEGRGESDDLLAVVAAQRAAGLPLVLGGFSFGAYVTTLAAARLEGEQRAERLLLVGPSTQRARPADVPEDTVVIHGETDDVVPLSATLDWARPQHLPVTVMPGVGHFFHGQLPRLRQLIVRSWH